MASGRTSPSLSQVFLRLVLLRLYLPLLVLGLTAIVGIGYLGEQNLKIQQYQIAQSMAQIVDHHLDQGGRILDAVARAAEISSPEDLSLFLKSTWEAYGYFETLYYLDKKNKIKYLMPPDPRYLDLDMSNVPDFQQTGEKKSLIISRPFISLRTGNPTVYLIRPLSQGGCVVGALNLGLFQQEITNITGESGKDFIFIMDQSGTLLAHPSSDLVKQQTNLSNLEIFRRGLTGSTNAVYDYAGTTVMGSTARVERTGWIVVNQIPLFVFFSSYAWTLGLILLVSLAIWLTLVWNLRKQFHRHVITPLVQLSQETNALTAGDFSRANSLTYVPTSFSELNNLTADFQFMSNTLQVREAALQESEERYRGLFARMPIGLFRATPDGQVLDINSAVVRIMGYPDRETLLTINFANFFASPMDRTQWQTRLNRKEVVHNFETKIRRYDGTIIWVQISGQVVHNHQEHMSYCEGSMEDITGRKQTEEALHQAKDDLELQVEQRTQELVALNKELQQLSSLDGLTGIGNRRYFDQFLEQEWQRGMRQGTSVALIMLDLDFFKDYNDIYGHQAGDDCLKQVATTLKSTLKRGIDLAARYGGEEFAAVMPDTDTAGAALLAEEIRVKIESLGIKHEKSPISQFVTVSLGIAAVVPRQGSQSSTIITAADQSLYQAKREGRNRVKIGATV